MNSAVIRGEGLGKKYRRGQIQENGLLRDSLARFARSPLSAFRRDRQETFWALKDVALEVREGEVLGLIGRNGAGKTTLLKVLSRITQPTTGWAEIQGRVGSLLEVGTGFHPELTGRENTFLSGAILGMSKREITAKFDEIVAFAELEKFIDTPVKHYSSGMYVRLAFAVAAHLEPEILLVDEVLAVGDINFQKKCLGKMGAVAKAGRTVVLVTHQMNQIRRLCNRVVWIDDGTVRGTGQTSEVVGNYESAMTLAARGASQDAAVRSNKAQFLNWGILDPINSNPHTLYTFGPVSIRFTLQVNQPIRRGAHGIALFNSDRTLIWGRELQDLNLAPGIHELRYTFPLLPLRPGPYSWLLSLFEDGIEVDMWDAVPGMMVSVEVPQHRLDEWSGLVNLPNEVQVLASPIIERYVPLGQEQK